MISGLACDQSQSVEAKRQFNDCQSMPIASLLLYPHFPLLTGSPGEEPQHARGDASPSTPGLGDIKVDLAER
jgi:hypothetical protein